MGYNFDYNFGYNFGPGLADVSSIAGTVFLVMMGVYALVGIYTVAAYVLKSLGMYTIAQRRSIKHPWLAWLPFGNLWILGSIADQYQYVSMGQVKSRRKVMLGLQIANFVLYIGIICIYVKMIADMLINYGGNPELMDEGSLVAMVLGMFLLVLAIWVVSVILMVFQYISLYNLYASCWPNCKVAFILLSILLGFTEPFLVFACRNKDLGMPPRKPKSVYETVAIPQPVAEPVVEPVAEPVVEPAAEPVEEPVEEPVAEAEAEEPAAEE